MNWSRLCATARRVGRVTAVTAMAMIALGFASMGVMDLVDKDQPISWGTYTELECEPPEFGWGECRSVGNWVSDDGSIVRDRIYLDGEVRPGGTVRASFRPQGWRNDAENNVVHTQQWTNAGGWISWAGTAITGTVAAWWAFRWWSRWGQAATWSEIFEDLTNEHPKREQDTGENRPA